MFGNKSAVGSLTVISAAVVILAQGAQLLGYSISDDDQAAIANLINSGLLVVTTVVSMIGAAGAIWGRVRATKRIGSVLPSSTTPAPADHVP